MLGRLLAVGLLSASLLAYELVLLRIFSIALWYHFAYLILSIAMLGFGASGTFLSFTRPRPESAERWFSLLALAAGGAQIIALALALRVPFEPFLVLWEPGQALRLLVFYLLLGVPFALAAAAAALALIGWGKVSTVYFANLAGAGIGAVAVTLLLYQLKPIETIGPLAAAAAFAAALSARRRSLSVLGLATALVSLAVTPGVLHQKVSLYKGISTALLLPEARRVARATSPLAVVEAVASPAIRYAPGLSLNFTGAIPAQIGLFADGDTAGAITRPGGDLSFLDNMTTALPYHLLDRPSVLVLGAGGGMEVLSALTHGARRVVAVELDPHVIRMVGETFGEFSGGLYEEPAVEVRVAEARSFLQTSGERFDLISISLLDSFVSSSAGLQAASESYLYTVEAIKACLDRLSPGGVLALTRWIKTPPRDVPRLFATLVAALEREGVASPGEHLAGIRSWATATLLLKKSPLSGVELDQLRRFCEERSFDRFWQPGLHPSETNRFHVLPQEFYERAARQILSPDRQAYLAEYPFRIDPATDDRPYFFNFFRWKTLPALIAELGFEWIPFVEWGYLILVAVVLQAALASAVLVLAPLVLSSSLRARASLPRARVALYFTCLGLGFLFIEVALIQKFILFLSHPVLSATTVLASVLFFSGLGSLLGGSLRLRAVSAGIALLCIAYMAGLPSLFSFSFQASELARMAVSVVAIAPAAFLMGIPFPRGLERVNREAPALAPWAWGVNGCASVIAPPLATLLAMSFGFRAVLAAAAGFYLLAGWALPARPGSPSVGVTE